jgi:hypothetical protein
LTKNHKKDGDALLKLEITVPEVEKKTANDMRFIFHAFPSGKTVFLTI